MPIETKLTLKRVRLSYCNVHRPEPNKLQPDQPPKYGCDALMSLNHPDLPIVKAAIVNIIQQTWPENWENVLTQLKAGGRLCLKSGNETKPGNEDYKDQMYVKASNKARPLVLGPDKSPLLEKDGKPYSGAWGNVILTIKVLTGTGPLAQAGKRVYAELNGVQHVADDKHFGGGGKAASADEFGVEAGDADGAPPSGAGSAADLL